MRPHRNVLTVAVVSAAVWLGLAGCSSKPSQPAGPDPATARGHLQEAKRLAQANKLNEALAEAKKARDSDPTLAEAYTLRAELFSKSAHFREARDELLAAHKALPDDVDVTIALLFDTQSYFPPAEAEAIARRAAEKAPDTPALHYFIGLAIVNGGDAKRLPEALKEFETANRLDPSAVPTITEMGKIHLQLGNAEKALALLESSAAILDESRKQVGAPTIEMIEAWTKERRAVAFWMADALKRLGQAAESRKTAALAGRLSAQSSELRSLQARLSLDPPDPAARKRLEEIARRGL